MVRAIAAGKMYQIGPSTRHGNGLLAARDITPGERILSERPLLCAWIDGDGPDRELTILPGFDELDAPEVGRVVALANRATGEAEAKRFRTQDAIAGSPVVEELCRKLFSQLVWPFNQHFEPGTVKQIFEDATWLNHDCDSNAHASWNEEKGVLQVQAMKRIGTGDEICISYLHQPFKDDNRRFKALPFACQCFFCLYTGYEQICQDLGEAHDEIRRLRRAHGFAAANEDVDFFAERDDVAEVVEAMVAPEREDLDCLALHMNLIETWLERGCVHPCVATAFETQYVVKAAQYTRKLAKLKRMNDGNAVQDAASDSTELDDIRRIAAERLRRHFDAEDAAAEEERLERRKKQAKSRAGKKSKSKKKAQRAATPPAEDDTEDDVRERERVAGTELEPVDKDSDEAVRRDLIACFVEATSAKLKQIEILSKCVGIDARRTQFAVQHAWNMCGGYRLMEALVRERLGKMGIWLRQTWSEDGSVVVRIGKT